MGAVRAIVRRQGGEVAVRSVPGEGTDVRFAFPLTMLEEEAPAYDRPDALRGAA